MKLNGTGVPTWIILAVIVICGAPASALNIWPRMELVLRNGAITSGELGILVLVTVSVLGMTAIPFAMKKAENWGFWVVCLTFGLALATLNYAMAVGAIGKVRDASANQALNLQAQAATLKSQIAERAAARAALSGYRHTTELMVQTATSAVTLAQQAVDQECNKVGDFCRARQAQLHARATELGAVSRDRALTEQGLDLDKSIRHLQAELTALGGIPRSVDPQAERLAAVVGRFYNLGDSPTESVADGLISVLAIIAEAFALGMPRIIVTALGEYRAKERARLLLRIGQAVASLIETRVETRRSNLAAATPQAGLKPAELEPKVAPPQPAPRPPAVPTKPRTKALVQLGAVHEWKAQTLITRQGSKLLCWDAYTSYKLWCGEKKVNPVAFAAFGGEMEVLGARKETQFKRDSYIDLEISKQLKVVA